MASAAPIAVSALGFGATVTGRPRTSETTWVTSGRRADPPVSSTAETSSGLLPATSIARCSVAAVSSTAGRIISSNSARASRTVVSIPGSATGIRTSVSAESASLADAHSRRNRASAGRTAGSAGSMASQRSPSARRTWSNTISSKSSPPSSSSSAWPAEHVPASRAVVELADHGGVEAGPAEVVDRDEVTGGERHALGVGTRGRLRSGQEHGARRGPAR